MFGLINFSKMSLSIQYMFFACMIGIITIVGLAFVSYETYEEYDHGFSAEISKQAQKLQVVLDDKIAFIEHFLQFIGSKIVESPDKSPLAIASLLKHYKSNLSDDVLGWNIVDYISTDGYLIADSKNGVKAPKYVANKREWIQDAKKKPWDLHFSKPALGLVTGDYIVPAGIGIYDDMDDTFYGYVTLGISIDKLLSNLLKIVNDDLAFVILDNKFRFLAASDPFLPNDIISQALSVNAIDFGNTTYEATLEIDLLTKPIRVNEYVFNSYVHLKHYPFWFLIGYDTKVYYKKLWNNLFPKLAMSIVLGVLCAGILIYLSYQVVKPIIMLGRAAEKISTNYVKTLPEFKALELNALADQLRNISQIHRNLHLKQAKLTKANHELITANEFIKSNMSFLSHELINPTSSIVEFSKLLLSRVPDKSNSEIREFLEIMNRISLHLYKQLNFFLRQFKFQSSRKSVEDTVINLRELIDWNISMLQHHIKDKQIKIHVDVSTDFKMLGDEIIIGQLIQNLLSNAVKYNKSDGKLEVKAKVTKKGETKIQFIDSGVGIAKKELQHIFKLFGRAKKTNDAVVGYGIGLAYAKQCVDAHGGSITVSSKFGEGSMFTVTFPKNRTIQ